jgi:hypothetical protein
MNTKLVRYGRENVRQNCTHPGSDIHDRSDARVALVTQPDGAGMCNVCLFTGLAKGQIDVANPGAVPRGTALAAALDQWGQEALDTLERAIEAAARQGKLRALAERLLASLNDDLSNGGTPPPGDGFIATDSELPASLAGIGGPQQ